MGLVVILLYDVRCALLCAFENISVALKKSETASEILKTIRLYADVIQVMEMLEDMLSLPLYFHGICCAIGLYRVGYAVAFLPQTKILFYVHCCTFLGVSLAMLVAVIMMASEITETFHTVRQFMISKQSDLEVEKKLSELRWRQQDINRKIHLSFWDTYVIDRSLVWKALKTLFEYGLLVGTLGRVSDKTV
ncbi:hypothetical protein CEXT_478651 [Caerostris extrusa]|uniref:Gustatory receptor n=1 Tax=Caerostris extrusa TaxID=172846 RepID=A0AAV4XYD9_CAEEX|nr:hypothetical protein CEXT_478651 [Caerostris extrusa]